MLAVFPLSLKSPYGGVVSCRGSMQRQHAERQHAGTVGSVAVAYPGVQVMPEGEDSDSDFLCASISKLDFSWRNKGIGITQSHRLCPELHSPHCVSTVSAVDSQGRGQPITSELSLRTLKILIFLRFIYFIIFMYMSALSPSIHVHYTHACCLRRSGEDVGSPGIGVTDSCELPAGCWESNAGLCKSSKCS